MKPVINHQPQQRPPNLVEVAADILMVPYMLRIERHECQGSIPQDATGERAIPCGRAATWRKDWEGYYCDLCYQPPVGNRIDNPINNAIALVDSLLAKEGR